MMLMVSRPCRLKTNNLTMEALFTFDNRGRKFFVGKNSGGGIRMASNSTLHREEMRVVPLTNS